MTQKVIQEQFGQAIIDAVASFAKKDIGTPAAFEAKEFSHVANASMKSALAVTLYGTRWLYKLGLALLADNQEQYAHVRAQIIDYASIAEALLVDMIVQGYEKGKLDGPTRGKKTVNGNQILHWNAANPLDTVEHRNFEWQIKVALESHIITNELSIKLNAIRRQRNTVHLTAKIRAGDIYFAGMAKRSHTAMNTTIKQTKSWVARNP